MSAGFTPGPWSVRPSDSEHYALISANTEFSGESKNGGIYVAKVQGPDKAANAHLIAAAPALYEALEVAESFFAGEPFQAEARACLAAVSAALKLARGERK